MNIDAFKKIISEFHGELQSIPEEITSVKLTPDTWSLKELLGHLVDSASNNHQRFVRLQFTPELVFPGYDQKTWNETERYNEFNWYDLIQLWAGYNKLLLHIISTLSADSLEHIWVYGERRLTLGWIVNDYYRHVQHHFDQFKKRNEEIQMLKP